MPFQSIGSLAGHTDRVWTLAWNPSGTILASSGADKSIRLWARNPSGDWVCAAILADTHNKSIRRLCWSPCGNCLASASFDSTVCIWKQSPVDGTWSTVVNLEGHESEVKSVAWSSDGNYLASCGRDRTIWIWERAVGCNEPDLDDESDDAANWDCSDVKNDHSKDVKHIIWHPNQNILVSCSYDDTIKFFHKEGEDWTCYDTLTSHLSTVWSADFSASGEYLATCSDDRTVRIWKNLSHSKLPAVETNSWKCVSVIQGYHSRAIYDISWNKSKDAIISAAGDNSLVLYGKGLGEPGDNGDNFSCFERLSQAHQCDVNSVAWNPKQSDILASAGDDREIKLWKYSADEKGTKPLTIIDELMQKLAESSLQSVKENDDSNKKEELTLKVVDFSNLLHCTKLLQQLQTELCTDPDRDELKKLLAEGSFSSQPQPIVISNMTTDQQSGLVRDLSIEMMGSSGEIEMRFKLVLESGFSLYLPRRSDKICVIVEEVFLLERTGDLYKILPNGQSHFLLGHLFTFAAVQFMLNEAGDRIRFIITADRDEKIRITNYPETYEIERYCFGHKHLVKRILVFDDKKFVSIDEKSEVAIWDLGALTKEGSSAKPLYPEKTLHLGNNYHKRLCT